METNKYLPLWEKYRAPILQKMKAAKEQNQTETYLLTKHEFTMLGERINTIYAFKMEIKNKRIRNNITGSSIARDLFMMLSNSKTACELWTDTTYLFQFDKAYNLSITVLADEVAPISIN